MDERAAAYGVIIRDGEMLLAHGTAGQQWTLPGGGIEPGEDPVDAAAREILEETGFEASIGQLLTVDSFVIRAQDRNLRAVRMIYEATIVGGSLTTETDGSTDDAQWFPVGEVSSLPRVPLVDAALSASEERS